MQFACKLCDLRKVNRIKNRHVKPWFVCNDEQCATEDLTTDKKRFDQNCPKKHVENRFVQMNEHLSGPFASPAAYKHYEDFQNITINIIATHICPLLDDAIEMYRKWPGTKTIHMFDNLPHGFIQFIDLSPSCKKASKQIVEIINSSIEDHCFKLNRCDDNNNDNNNDKNDEKIDERIDEIVTDKMNDSDLSDRVSEIKNDQIVKNIIKSNKINDIVNVDTDCKVSVRL